MENNATTPRTARPAMAPLGSVFECTAHKLLLDVLDSPELEQPGDVVPLARILVTALPVKGSVKM